VRFHREGPHHGGAGTTAAGLRAGVPSVITPFAADQCFWARQVEQLGVGVAAPRLRKLSALVLAAALTRATREQGIQELAARLGVCLQAEDGAGRAAALIAQMVG
jgi:sterol 3beta-glucosyltransferase